MEAGLVVDTNIRLVRSLGEGGMGSVWLADHLALETQVVVKFMHADLGADATSRERFSREAIAASKVKSPHVVQTFDHGVMPDGTAFIVMERLEGEDLGQRIAKGTLSPREAALVVTQTCRALGRAHGVGIVHRDIKPDNIFLCDVGAGEPFVKLLDFGIAKASLNPALDTKTRTGAMMGTPYYMSPEQFAGKKSVDFRSDLWSLGIVAFECLTGRRPFDAETLGGLAIAVHSGPFPVPSQMHPDCQPFDAWFTRACSREPADRFQSAKEFSDTFEAIAMQMGSMSAIVLQGAAAYARGSNPMGFTGTDPVGVAIVPPALLLSTGATGSFTMGDVGAGAAPAPPVVPSQGRSKAAIFAVAGMLAIVSVGAFALRSRGGSRNAAVSAVSAGEQPAKTVAPPPVPPAANPPPPEEAQRLAPLPAAAAPVAPAAAAPIVNGPAAPAPVATVHAGSPRPAPVHAAAPVAPAAAAAPAAPPVATASHAAAPPPPNCNPPYTLDSAGVRHPKVECL